MSERNRQGSWHWMAQQRVKTTNSPNYIDTNSQREALEVPDLPVPSHSPSTPYSEPFEHIGMQQMSDHEPSSPGYSTCTPDSPVERERLGTGVSAFSVILRERLDTGKSVSPSLKRLRKEDSPGRESIIEKQVLDAILGEDRNNVSPKSVTRPSHLDISRASSVKVQYSPGLQPSASPSRAPNRQSWSDHSFISSAASRNSSFGNRSDIGLSRNSSKASKASSQSGGNIGVSRHSSKASSKSQQSFRVQIPRQSSINEQDVEISPVEMYAKPIKFQGDFSDLANVNNEFKRNPSPVTPSRKNYLNRESGQFCITSNPAYVQQNDLPKICKVTDKAKEQYLDYANVCDESEADYANLTNEENENIVLQELVLYKPPKYPGIAHV